MTIIIHLMCFLTRGRSRPAVNCVQKRTPRWTRSWGRNGRTHNTTHTATAGNSSILWYAITSSTRTHPESGKVTLVSLLFLKAWCSIVPTSLINDSSVQWNDRINQISAAAAVPATLLQLLTYPPKVSVFTWASAKAPCPMVTTFLGWKHHTARK